MKNKTGMLFLIYCIAAAIIASVIRFFQYVSIIDFNTGFFIKDAESAGMLIYVVMLVLAIGYGVVIFFGVKNKWTATTVSSDGMDSKSTIIVGVCYLLAAAVSVFAALNLEGSGFFRIISGYAFAISLAALGLLFMKSSVPPAVSGFINLFPALFYFMQATQLFTDDLVIKNRSDNLIVLLCYVLGTLFFASVARFFARLESKHTRVREIVLSGLTFMLSTVHVLSKVLVYLFGGDSAKLMSGISFEVLALMLISGAFLATICTTAQHKEIDYLIEEEKKEKEK